MLNFRLLLRSCCRLPLLMFLILHITIVQAQEVVVKRSTVIEQYKGKPYYLHFVQKDETETAIAKAYQISKADLVSENPFLQDGIKPDQVLRIPKRDETGDQESSESEVKQEMKQDKAPEIKPVPTDSKEVAREPGAKPSAQKATGKVYIVKKKETLYGISRQFNISVEELQKANPQMTSLQEGMELIIPEQVKETTVEIKKSDDANKPVEPVPASIHLQEITVNQGQTIYSLSRQYGITVEQFLNLNPEAAQGLKADQTVRVPESGGSTGNMKGAVEKVVPAREPDNKITKSPTAGNYPASRHSIKNDSCWNNAHLDRTYEIALLLPFDLENSDSIFSQDEASTLTVDDFKSYDFFQFYSGILLAADSLEKSGFKAHINVFDADKESDTLKIRKALRKNNLSGMDLVIGPVFARSFEVASRTALKEKIPIVNPLSRRERIIAGNPYVYMIQPSDESLAEGLAGFIAHNYKGANVIVCRNGAKELASLYSSFIRNLKKYDSLPGMHIKEINYAVESFASLTKNLSSDKHNVILMFSDSRSLVPNFVSLLNNANKNQDITLFGLPGWESIGIETEFLSKLDYHEVCPTFVDYNSEAVNQFVKQFRAAYGTEPLVEKQAFLGFDIGWYFFQALMNFGPSFGPCLGNLDVNSLQTNFDFSVGAPGNGFQNSTFRIIQLNDYKWVECKQAP
jgi:LysM repeat protein/ABC-type branched-subunit amino acid transport system substrate-binding protein